MSKSKVRKTLSMALATCAIVVGGSSSFGAVEAYITEKDEVSFEYQKSDLIDSILDNGPMVQRYRSERLVGLKDNLRGYVDLESVVDYILDARDEGRIPDVDKFTETSEEAVLIPRPTNISKIDIDGSVIKANSLEVTSTVLDAKSSRAKVNLSLKDDDKMVELAEEDFTATAFNLTKAESIEIKFDSQEKYFYIDTDKDESTIDVGDEIRVSFLHKSTGLSAMGTLTVSKMYLETITVGAIELPEGSEFLTSDLKDIKIIIEGRYQGVNPIELSDENVAIASSDNRIVDVKDIEIIKEDGVNKLKIASFGSDGKVEIVLMSKASGEVTRIELDVPTLENLLRESANQAIAEAIAELKELLKELDGEIELPAGTAITRGAIESKLPELSEDLEYEIEPLRSEESGEEVEEEVEVVESQTETETDSSEEPGEEELEEVEEESEEEWTEGTYKVTVKDKAGIGTPDSVEIEVTVAEEMPTGEEQLAAGLIISEEGINALNAAIAEEGGYPTEGAITIELSDDLKFVTIKGGTINGDLVIKNYDENKTVNIEDVTIIGDLIIDGVIQGD